MRFLGLDVGTTRMKCGIYDEQGNFVYSDSIDYGEIKKGKGKYIDIESISKDAIELLVNAYKKFPYDTIAVSSLGESFVAFDKDGNILFLPMLFTDSRGKDEAEWANSFKEEIFQISGVFPQGMYSVYKLLWIKNNCPDIFNKIDKIFLVNEYISYLLTGERVIDYAQAARTGMFDIREKVFSKTLADKFGININIFSTPKPCGNIIGKIKEEYKALFGTSDIYVVTGGHDQVCATLGSGITESGLCTDGMGTCETITAVYDNPSNDLKMGSYGYPNVPFLDSLYCTYLLNYSCGSLQRWWLSHCFQEEEIRDGSVFPKVEGEFEDKPTGLLVLPYFEGAANPYQNIDAKGAILNLTIQDSPSTIFKGILEAMCYEMKLNLDYTKKFGIKPKKLIVTGGGSKDKYWLQMKADIMNLPVYQLKVKEAGICGAAMLGYHALTKKPLKEITKVFVSYGDVYKPRKEMVKEYSEIYKKYKKLYKTLKEFY